MSEQEMLDYLLSTGLYEVTDEKRSYNDLFYEYRMIKTDKTVPIKELVEVTEDKVVKLSMLRLEAEELRAEHRNERERTDCRHDHDDAGNPTELLEHESCHTLDHGQREEHGKHCQC